jgi:spore maturation protein CgeB
LCFLSKRYAETTTTRTFEITGCATFMLAERTGAHLELFTEGVEAEYFDTELELADKIRFYVRHPRARQKIAEAGHARCIRSGYGNQARIQALLAQAWTPKSNGAAAAA